MRLLVAATAAAVVILFFASGASGLVVVAAPPSSRRGPPGSLARLGGRVGRAGVAVVPGARALLRRREQALEAMGRIRATVQRGVDTTTKRGRQGVATAGENQLATTLTIAAAVTAIAAIVATQRGSLLAAARTLWAGIIPFFLELSRSELFAAGVRRDSFALLTAAATAIPLAKALGISPIIGFLVSGVALGPNGFSVISELHTTEVLGELGVVFFLFEMGLELSVAKLRAMKQEIFGLGATQFFATAAAISLVASRLAPSFSAAALTVVGGSLALSSSAFVLQLLRDQEELSTRHGRAALGVLLLQDLAVVPLLVVVPLLARASEPGLAAASSSAAVAAIGAALGAAALKAAAAIAAVSVVGKRVFDAALRRAAKSRSQEAFLATVLVAAVGVSAATEAIGLSTTLGAFLAGISLSETRYAQEVEANVAPFRGMLLGLFFVTVGFSIDIGLLLNAPVKVLGLAAGILGLKTAVLTTAAWAFKLPFAAALRCGLLLAQGGEFAFVAFSQARKLGLLDSPTERLLLTATALSMACTPVLSSLGAWFQQSWEATSQSSRSMDECDTVANCLEDVAPDRQLRDYFGDKVDTFKPAVVVCGYGSVGKVVCELLDAKLERYIVIDSDPERVGAARADGKPIFLGDVTKTETLRQFGVDRAKVVVLTVKPQRVLNSAVLAVKRLVPTPKMVVRAADATHSRRLQKLGIEAPPTQFRDDSRLLSLPFGGAVLRSLGFRATDVNMLIEERRASALSLFADKSEESDAYRTLLQEIALEDEEDKKGDKEDTKDKKEGDASADAKESTPAGSAAA